MRMLADYDFDAFAMSPRAVNGYHLAELPKVAASESPAEKNLERPKRSS